MENFIFYAVWFKLNFREASINHVISQKGERRGEKIFTFYINLLK